jgi:ASC-1-like (ASCH) protein
VTVHKLKIDKEPFEALQSGAKTCEVRNDDRGFEVGDWVMLIENGGNRKTNRMISHIQRGYGLPEGICVLSYGFHKV